MKPGQSVEIAARTTPGAAAIHGRVALVADGELVIHLDAPQPGLFTPRTPVALSYRDETGEHQVNVRVVGMQGTERVIVTLPPDSAEPADQRRHVRVEHLLRMEYQVLAPEEVDEARATVLDGPRILKYERQSTSAAPQVAGAENEPPPPEWSESPGEDQLRRIERKLDLLLERLGIETPRTDERSFYNVSLSAGGLRFRDYQRRVKAGDMVLVCLELPLSPTVEVYAIAETLYVVEDIRQLHLSTGRDVVLEFRVIKDESRELIARYCQTYLPLRRSA